MRGRTLLLCTPPAAIAPLAELLAAWRRDGIRVRVRPYDNVCPDVAALVARAHDVDAALLVTNPRRAPATVLPAPFVIDARGRKVPVASLPATSPAALLRFARTAAAVRGRSGRRRAIALLGQWHPQYLQLSDRIGAIVGSKITALRWTGDGLMREDLLDALRCGVGVGVYVGHGRASGWVGYHGVRARHLADASSGEPMGAILSLCCRTASRRRVGLSYAEALPLQGVAAASFGAVTDTVHSDNTRWAVGVSQALLDGADTIADLLVKAAPTSPGAICSYRLIGDPLAPIATAATALRRARRVQTYA